MLVVKRKGEEGKDSVILLLWLAGAVFSPRFRKAYPANGPLIFSQVWLRSNKMQKEKHSFGVKMTGV